MQGKFLKKEPRFFLICIRNKRKKGSQNLVTHFQIYFTNEKWIAILWPLFFGFNCINRGLAEEPKMWMDFLPTFFLALFDIFRASNSIPRVASADPLVIRCRRRRRHCTHREEPSLGTGRAVRRPGRPPPSSTSWRQTQLFCQERARNQQWNVWNLLPNGPGMLARRILDGRRGYWEISGTVSHCTGRRGIGWPAKASSEPDLA